jgi:hypothetical protein
MMKESKQLTERWIKASFFTKMENDRILHALKLHQAGKMDLLNVVGIFDITKEHAVTRTRQLQTQKQINQMLDKLV